MFLEVFALGLLNFFEWEIIVEDHLITLWLWSNGSTHIIVEVDVFRLTVLHTMVQLRCIHHIIVIVLSCHVELLITATDVREQMWTNFAFFLLTSPSSVSFNRS